MYTETKNEKTYWQVQEAKAMFSEVIKATSVKPQTITIRGKEAAVLLSIDDYRKLVRPRQTLYEFVQDSPLCELKLALPKRLPEKMREIDW